MNLLPGVYKAKKKDGTIYFRSSITFRNKHISLGSFPTETEAHKAYIDASKIIGSETPYQPDNYNKKDFQFLNFHKYISLCNFKNNGIYIKTPIYLRANFFNYYLSQRDVLTFDVDDLFYYSNHSIMRRGNHLFVAEYGMQTNIASRYGIRNFARPGIDFRYVNGDINDYRYSNIEILNRYQGVTVEQKKEGYIYISRIHANGNYLIGRFSSIHESAIAYNKAADHLKKSGFSKNFTQNYIEEISSAEYIDIYNSINLPKSILELKSNKQKADIV